MLKRRRKKTKKRMCTYYHEQLNHLSSHNVSSICWWNPHQAVYRTQLLLHSYQGYLRTHQREGKKNYIQRKEKLSTPYISGLIHSYYLCGRRWRIGTLVTFKLISDSGEPRTSNSISAFSALFPNWEENACLRRPAAVFHNISSTTPPAFSEINYGLHITEFKSL